jgi:hypothetical protein
VKFIYDSHTLMPQEDAITVANRWGEDGWRWVNPYQATVGARTRMIFEREDRVQQESLRRAMTRRSVA